MNEMRAAAVSKQALQMEIWCKTSFDQPDRRRCCVRAAQDNVHRLSSASQARAVKVATRSLIAQGCSRHKVRSFFDHVVS